MMTATIGAIVSSAIENRSSRSRLRPRASDRMIIRQRSQTRARRYLTRSSTSDPVERRPRLGSADEPDEDLFERAAAARVAAQLRNRTLRDQPPLRDDADVIAQPLDDLEDVRGQEDRAAAGDEGLQQILDLARRERVDALEGLVEEEQSRARGEARPRATASCACRASSPRRAYRTPWRDPRARAVRRSAPERPPATGRGPGRRSRASPSRSAVRRARDLPGAHRRAASRQSAARPGRAPGCSSSRSSAAGVR